MICLYFFSILLIGIYGKNPKEPYVYEMDDRIIDFATQGKWLIQFYAPWCGHCKKMEPIYQEVGKYFHGHPMVSVAKVDATRFVKAASHFEVKGYPTIKYVYGKKRVNFYGERRKEDLIEFVERCDAERVVRINHQLDFENTKHKTPMFFILMMKPGEETAKIKTEFYELAERYFLDAYFYYTKPEFMIKTVKVNDTPSVGVIRDNELIIYKPTDYPLERFIKLEMFQTFCEVTASNFHNLMDTQKILMILLMNSEDMTKINQTRKEFQFGYTENHELLSGIAIWSLPTPVLFIFNTTSFEYSLVELLDKKNKMIEIDFDKILDDLRNQRIDEMFVEAPFISLLIFGFPFGVISIVCYFMCCVDAADTADEPEELSDSEAEDEHQYLLNEASRLHETINDNRKLDGEENRIKIPSNSKKSQ